jgi:hypothetical protein
MGVKNPNPEEVGRKYGWNIDLKLDNDSVFSLDGVMRSVAG